jgi:hypothetical protein
MKGRTISRVNPHHKDANEVNHARPPFPCPQFNVSFSVRPSYLLFFSASLIDKLCVHHYLFIPFVRSKPVPFDDSLPRMSEPNASE